MNTVGGDTGYADTQTDGRTDGRTERHTTPIIGHGPITVVNYSVGIIGHGPITVVNYSVGIILPFYFPFRSSVSCTHNIKI